MKNKTKLNELMDYTKVSSKSIIEYVNIDKTYFSKLKNNRNIKQTNKYYEDIKSFFLINYETALSNFFNCQINELNKRYDDFILGIPSFNEIVNEEVMIAIDNNFDFNYLDNKNSDIFNNIIKNAKSINIYVAQNNYKAFAYLIYTYYNLILEDKMKIFSGVNINASVIYIKNIKYATIFQLANKTHFDIYSDKLSSAKYFNNIFKYYQNNSKTPYQRVNQIRMDFLAKLIPSKIAHVSKPVYVTTHPHYSCISEDYLEIMSKDLASTRFKDLIKIISAKDKKIQIDVISSYDVFVSENQKYLASGIAIFLDKSVYMSKDLYSKYLQTLIKNIKNEYVNLKLVKYQFNCNITFLDNYLIMYPEFDVEKNICLVVTDQKLIINLKAYLNKVINKHALSKASTLKTIEEVVNKITNQ